MSSSEPINPDRLYTIKALMELEGISHGEAYRRFNKGQYAPVVKDGRSTKVWGREINKRREAELRLLKTPALDALGKAG
jgi:hypothetical protein